MSAADRVDTEHQRRLTLPAPPGHTVITGPATITATHVTVTLDLATSSATPTRAATRQGDLTVRVTGHTPPGSRPRHAIYHPRRPSPDLSSHPDGPMPEWVAELIGPHLPALEN